MKKKIPPRKRLSLKKRFRNYVRKKSPWILHMGCGSCNPGTILKGSDAS